MPIMRLDRFFSSQEILSRKQVKPLIKSGAIKVNDTFAQSCEQKINTDTDSIFLSGKQVPYKPFVYIMLNKPEGVVSSTNDKLNKTVLSLVPPKLWRSDLFPAGRLDKDTVGFVLITNDGDFAHNILSPKNHIAKRYTVRLDNPISAENISQIEQGITLADGTSCQRCAIELQEDTKTPLLAITICEGKYHQIKRMFGVVECGVTFLKRTHMGGVPLDKSLDFGECRELTNQELLQIVTPSTII